MRKQSIALVAAIALGTLGGSSIAHAQTTNAPLQKKVFGFQDPRTGVFHPLGHGPDLSENPAATTTYSGTIEVTVTITLKTALPKGDSVACSVDALAGSGSPASPLGVTVAYDESATSTASVSGSTATCKVNIPYSWVLPTPSATVTDSLDGNLTVVMYSPTATTITTELEELTREHTQPITINGGTPGDGTLSVSVAVTI
jgi:hypothetical protein